MTDYSKPDLAAAELIRVHACYTNTDRTEGKGQQYSFAWAQSRITAQRLAQKQGVMGTDAEVQEIWAIKIGNVTYVPKRIEPPTQDDMIADGIANAHNALRDKAVAAMREAGMSEIDIKKLVKPPL